MRHENCLNKTHMAYLNSAQAVDYENAERRRHPAIFREVPSSPQLGPEQTEKIFLSQLQLASKRSRYIQLEQTFTALRDQLSKLRGLQAGWDSYGAPAPNEVALAAAESALDTLRTLIVQPTSILPSADGGIGVCFTHNDQYAHIEFENSGDTWILIYGADTPAETWQLPSNNEDSIREAWGRISASLQS
jgi:hypothetical protein